MAKIIQVFVLLGLLFLGAGIIYWFPPSDYNFYPPCVWKRNIGIYCAGCGMTRCCHSLLNGELKQAFAYNPIFPIFALAILVFLGLSSFERDKSKRKRAMSIFTICICAFFFLFTLLRNLPWEPFVYLAPHELTP